MTSNSVIGVAFRRSRICSLSISRMLDMGGLPSAATASPVRSTDAIKNCKLQAVIFDFDLLTRSLDGSRQNLFDNVTAPQVRRATGFSDAKTSAPNNEMEKSNNEASLSSAIHPNINLVQDIANLFSVQMGGDRKRSAEENDDLSALTGEVTNIREVGVSSESTGALKKTSSHVSTIDIRGRYADKLKSKLSDNGSATIAAIDRAKQQGMDSRSKGDAEGFAVARKLAINNQSQAVGEDGGIAASSSSSSSTRWMAHTGTGTLMQYVSNRSMKIALVPRPNTDDAEGESVRMDDFSRQLPRIRINLMMKTVGNAKEILEQAAEELPLSDPVFAMVISDRDDYLREAKSMGMITCRVRPDPNARRGNISAHYNVLSIGEVQDVVNEINGISFNALGN